MTHSTISLAVVVKLFMAGRAITASVFPLLKVKESETAELTASEDAGKSQSTVDFHVK